MLRFVARKTEPTDARIASMMLTLTQLADTIDSQGGFSVMVPHLEMTARALAGVAAFLQKQILPEVVATQNSCGERQVRWGIETAMSGVNILLASAAEIAGGSQTAQPVHITLPPPPV